MTLINGNTPLIFCLDAHAEYMKTIRAIVLQQISRNKNEMSFNLVNVVALYSSSRHPLSNAVVPLQVAQFLVKLLILHLLRG